MTVEVVGSANVDIVLSLARAPGPGETVFARSQARHPGGKGANQAAAAARMGAVTRFLGAVGADEAGGWLRARLAESGVDVSGLLALAEAPTGTAYITVEPGGENRIIVVPGANGALRPEALAPAHGPTKVVLAQGEVPAAVTAEAFTRAGGALCLFNPAPADPALLALFPLCDVLIVNEHELADYCAAADLPAPEDESAGARALLANPRRAPRRAVVVTLGARGALYVERPADGGIALESYIPAFAVTPRDTTGAGDCFCGALAALLAGDMALDEGLRLASAAAALSTLTAGALPAMPSRAEAEAFAQTANSPA